jgi:hypothetical protein
LNRSNLSVQFHPHPQRCLHYLSVPSGRLPDRQSQLDQSHQYSPRCLRFPLDLLTLSALLLQLQSSRSVLLRCQSRLLVLSPADLYFRLDPSVLHWDLYFLSPPSIQQDRSHQVPEVLLVRLVRLNNLLVRSVRSVRYQIQVGQSVQSDQLTLLRPNQLGRLSLSALCSQFLSVPSPQYRSDQSDQMAR